MRPGGPRANPTTRTRFEIPGDTMSKNTLLTLGALALGLAAPAATFGVCPTTPTDWDSENCTVNGGATTVCSYTTSAFTCDLSAASGASEITLVSSYDSTYFIEAWGDWNGEEFCCHTPSGWTGDDVIIYDSDYSDSIALYTPTWATWSTTPAPPTTRSPTSRSGVVAATTPSTAPPRPRPSTPSRSTAKKGPTPSTATLATTTSPAVSTTTPSTATRVTTRWTAMAATTS